MQQITGPVISDWAAAAARSLEDHPSVLNVHLAERAGATRSALVGWEASHGPLPDDLRSFFMLCDGMELKWDVLGHGRDVVPLGRLAVNSLAELLPVDASALRNERDELRPELPAGASASALRAFDLDASCESGRVVLLFVGEAASRRVQIWFQDASCAWAFVANSFTDYFRLLVLHMGLPRWQYAYTEVGLDPVARQWFRCLAPERLSAAKGHSALRSPAGAAAPGRSEALSLLMQGGVDGAGGATRTAAGAPRSAAAELRGGGASYSRSSSSSSASSAAAGPTPRPPRVGSAGPARPTGGAGRKKGGAGAAGRVRGRRTTHVAEEEEEE